MLLHLRDRAFPSSGQHLMLNRFDGPLHIPEVHLYGVLLARVESDNKVPAGFESLAL